MALIAVSVLSGVMGSAIGHAADSIGTLTIVDGPVQVLQEMHLAQAVVGMQLAPDAIVETGPKAFVQIETVSGLKVDLGPDTRLLTSTSVGTSASLLKGGFLLAGWLKVGGTDAASASIGNPYFDVDSIDGTLVEYVTGDQAAAFIEVGKAKAVDPRSHAEVDLTTAHSYVQRKGERGQSAAGAGLLGAPPPVAFRDTLPALWRKFEGAKAPVVTATDFSYAQVRDWLVVDAAVRRQFVRLWRAKAEQEDFRAGLIADLAAHPEWRDILFPPVKADNTGRAAPHTNMTSPGSEQGAAQASPKQ
jgi:hypothetical protein